MAVCVVNCIVDRRNCYSHSSKYRSDIQMFVENREFYLSHLQQELRYRKQIARQLRTQYVQDTVTP